MPYTVDYRFGDVVELPAGTPDATSADEHAGVVISNRMYHTECPYALVMAIEKTAKQSTNDVEVRDWQGAGLGRAATIKPLIATVDRGRIVKRLGELTDHDRDALRLAISTILG